MSSPSCRYAKKRKSPTDAALTTEQPFTSIHTSSKSSSAEDHSLKLLEQNNQRNNDNEADFLSFLTKMSNSVRGLTDHFAYPLCALTFYRMHTWHLNAFTIFVGIASRKVFTGAKMSVRPAELELVPGGVSDMTRVMILL
jgi:hypothetical protein